MDFIITLVALAIVLLLMYFLFQEIQRQQKVTDKYKQKKLKKKSLNKKLLTMLSGDEKAAIRLLSNIQKKNPDKSYVWCQEKVIRDLERDRR
jgi:uncharacterized protein HemY